MLVMKYDQDYFGFKWYNYKELPEYLHPLINTTCSFV